MPIVALEFAGCKVTLLALITPPSKATSLAVIETSPLIFALSPKLKIPLVVAVRLAKSPVENPTGALKVISPPASRTRLFAPLRCLSKSIDPVL